MGELIAVLSGKGGTGKTSVCAGVATALAEDGCSVLCIDCDVGLRNLDISLGLSQSGALSFAEVCEGSYSLRQAFPHPDYPSLAFLTAPVSSYAGPVDEASFGSLLEEAGRTYDYVLLDAPAGIGAGVQLAAQFASRILLVTEANPAAVRDAGRAGELLEQMGKARVRLVINRVSRRLVRAVALNLDDVMDQSGLPLIGVVPEDPRVPICAARDRPLLLSHRRGAAKAFRNIAKRIQGRIVPLSMR